MRIFLSLLMLSWALSSFSQTMAAGKVLDQKTKDPLLGATVILDHTATSTRKAVFTDSLGRFFFRGIPIGEYDLSVQYIGYLPHKQKVAIKQGFNKIGELAMKVDVKMLETVEIEKIKKRAELNGDTLELNPEAYKVNNDATAEDLLEKMPGIVISDGKVQAQGEDVKEVLVDGKPFFGGDPNTVLKNLPAEVIKKIQVFDQESQQDQLTGFNTGNTTKTLNLTLKEEFKNGAFGKAYAGYGYEDKYRVGGNINLFKDKKRITFIGQSNNINIQNFATEDLLGVVSQQNGRRGPRGGGGGGRPRGGGPGGLGGGPRGGGISGDANDFLVGQQGGISTTHAFGVNYQNSFGKKIELVSSYFFNLSDNDSRVFTQQDYFSPIQRYTETETTNSTNINHRLNLRLKYNISDNDMILFLPRLTMQLNEGTDNIAGLNVLEDSLVDNYKDLSSSDLTAINWSGRLLYRHSFAKRGRVFTTMVEHGIAHNSGESQRLYHNLDANNLLTDSLDQEAFLKSNDVNYKVGFTFSEPIKNSFSKGVMLSYNYAIEPAESRTETFNLSSSSNTYTDLDTNLSNVFDNTYRTHTAGLAYRIMNRQKRSFLMFKLDYQLAKLINEQTFPTPFDNENNFNSLQPSVVFKTNLSEQKKLFFIYRLNAQKPTTTQLQEVIDNSNALQLSIGNSGLRQQNTHHLHLRYNATNVENGTVFFAGLMGNFSTNYIANSTFTATTETVFSGIDLATGTQLSTYENLKGYLSLSSFVSYGIPISLLKSNLNINLNTSYSKTPAVSNNMTYFTHNESMSLGLVLGSNISEYIDFTLSSNSSLNLTQNELTNNQNNQYLTQISKLRLNIRSKKGLLFETTYNHQFYAGFSDELAQQFSLLGVGIGKKMFKNQLGEIKLYAFDALNQNNSNTQTTYNTYIEQVNSLVLRRYYMLSFTYNIRAFKNDKKG